MNIYNEQATNPDRKQKKKAKGKNSSMKRYLKKNENVVTEKRV